ncbi:MAG: ribbon-helix-helix protein, CopG family [Acidobacteria bacterium]|nr:ribbon-helix-helix protein, CopG family [Acidobacteriota bacterium]
MELSKKTTILLSEEQHEQLTRLARERGTSLGDLIREACAQEYGLASTRERAAAIAELALLSLPVGDVATMKRESIATSKEPRR